MFDNPLPDEPYKTVTIKDVVYQRLKEAIIRGRLTPGERLKETTLSAMLNVSRTPLREAFQRLEQDGLVNRVPQGGVVVSSISVDEATQLNDIRANLEGLAARRAAERVKQGALAQSDHDCLMQFATVLHDMQRFKETGDLASGLEAGRQFHFLVHQLSGNPRLAALLAQVIEGLQRYRALIPQERETVIVGEHEAIADAIKDGQPDLAEARMKAHVAAAEKVYRAIAEGA